MKLCGSLERSGSVMSVSSRLVSYKEAGNVLERGLESRCEGGEKGAFASVVIDDVDISMFGSAVFAVVVVLVVAITFAVFLAVVSAIVVVFTVAGCCNAKPFVVVVFMGCMAISRFFIIVVFPVVLIGSPFACACDDNGFVLKLLND